jgi:uncharacterized protein YukE
MSDLNVIVRDATTLRIKILKDLETLMRMYGEFEGSVTDRFKDEYTKSAGAVSGLEDFYMLHNTVKKNNISVKNAYALLKRMRDVAGYEITEEEVLDKELEELLK